MSDKTGLVDFARTLKERLMSNPNDAHGRTSILSAQEIDDLVAYLKTL